MKIKNFLKSGFLLLLLIFPVNVFADAISSTPVVQGLNSMMEITGRFNKLEMTEITEPDTPSTTGGIFYFDSVDSKPKAKSDAGVNYDLTTGTGGGDFADGGEAGGADRTIGNTDNYDLGFLVNNLNKLHIQNDGKVGIGTTTPSEVLDVNGAVIAAEYKTSRADGLHRNNVSNTGDYSGGDEVSGDEHYNKTDKNKAIYEDGAWNAIPHILCETKTITEPDTIADKTVLLRHYMAEAYPNGITIKDIAITASSAMSDTHTLQAFDTRDDGTPTTIEAIAMSATVRQEDDGTLSNSTVPADGFLVIELDAAVDNVDSMEVTWTYVINAL